MPKILTVDDSRAIRLLVSKHAKDIGLDVHEAEDGERGLARLKDETFDMVVLDITMPVLDGPGMLTRMREGGDKTPVLMLTSESKKSIVAQLMRLGINDYILKPFRPGELQTKMMKILKMDGAGPAAVLDLPSVTEKVARLVIDMRERSAKVGVELRVVGGADPARKL